MEDLEPFGCWFDTWSETLVAISVGATNARSVADYLKIKESAAELKYETGRTE
jgi:phosphatidylserine decarboxylase